MLWEDLLLNIDPLKKKKRIRRIRKGYKVLGHPSPVRPKNPNLTRVRQNASTARSRDTEKRIILNTLPPWI